MTYEVSNLAGLAIVGFAFFAGALLLFMVFVQPIWCLIDCAVDGRRSGAGKAVWIIVLVLFYGIANWFYGAFAAAGRALRWLTRLAWLLLLLLIAAFIAMYHFHADFRRGIEEEWQRSRALVVHAELPALHAPELT